MSELIQKTTKNQKWTWKKNGKILNFSYILMHASIMVMNQTKIQFLNQAEWFIHITLIWFLIWCADEAVTYYMCLSNLISQSAKLLAQKTSTTTKSTTSLWTISMRICCESLIRTSNIFIQISELFQGMTNSAVDSNVNPLTLYRQGKHYLLIYSTTSCCSLTTVYL